jgi:hypothetical protein
MKPIIPVLTALILLPCAAQAQKSNPFQTIGKTAIVHTLSNGRYQETFDNDVLQRVGTVIIDRRTKKIVRMLDADSVNNEVSDNSTASRWYSVDPLAEKYYSISPYAFCANNPILYVDPNGAELVLSGAVNDVNSAVQRIQNSVGGSYNVAPNENGSIVMTPNASFSGEVSSQQQSAINTYSPILSLETGMTQIGVVNNSDQVDVGSFATGQIDVGDMAQYDNINNTSGEATVYSGNGKMIHEMQEQFQKQTTNADMFDAHNSGINAENSYNGSTRPNAVMRNGTMVAPASDESMNSNSTKYTHRQNVRGGNGNVVTVVETYNVTNSKEVKKNPSAVLKTNLTDVKQTPQQH